jgi:RimJ/RimL family protein N-acetyltransferase
MIIPQLTTDRLVLRGLELRDFEAYAVMMADPLVTRYLADGQPLARSGAWRQLEQFIGHWALRGFGLWAVEERTTGAFMGRIGCVEPEGWPGFEVGYALARPFWGQGYALNYARNVLHKERIISLVRPENSASARVAERLGAAPAGEVDFFGGPTRVFLYGNQ